MLYAWTECLIVAADECHARNLLRDSGRDPDAGELRPIPAGERVTLTTAAGQDVTRLAGEWADLLTPGIVEMWDE